MTGSTSTLFDLRVTGGAFEALTEDTKRRKNENHANRTNDEGYVAEG
jgi:hypothetical protein